MSTDGRAVTEAARSWRRGAWMIGALALAGAVGSALYYADGEAGYVLITFGRFSLETSVWFGGLALMALYVAVRALGAAWRALFGVRGWWQQRRTRLARTRTSAGLLALLQGDWSAARKQLLASAAAADAPAVNLIFAARAAHEEGDRAQATAYLQQAETQLGAQHAAAVLQRLTMFIEAGGEPPISELQQLRDRVPSSAGVLRTLARALERAEQWSALAALFPALRKQQVFAPPELAELERRIWRGTARAATSLATLQQQWNALGRAERSDRQRVLAYCIALHRLGADAEAESLVRETLAGEWQYQLVTLYGLLRADLGKQQRQAEQWLAAHPDDGALLQAIGRLHAAAGNWQQARNSFQAALVILGKKGSDNWGASSERCAIELTDALLQLGEHDAAREQLRTALSV